MTLVIPGPGAGAVLWERKAPWVPRDGLCECTHFKLFKLFQIISKLQSVVHRCNTTVEQTSSADHGDSLGPNGLLVQPRELVFKIDFENAATGNRSKVSKSFHNLIKVAADKCAKMTVIAKITFFY